MVAPDRLRFDFSHYEAVTPEQIQAIEDLVNRDVLANDPVRHFETTKAEAAELGAIAFFGEKYGDIVRVLEAGPHSTELCGGTHVGRLGDRGAMFRDTPVAKERTEELNRAQAEVALQCK